MGPYIKRLVVTVAVIVTAFAQAGAARADDVKVHFEGVMLDKLPQLKTYITVVDDNGKAVHAKTGYKLLLDQTEQKDLAIQYMPFAEVKEPMDVVVVVQLSP